MGIEVDSPEALEALVQQWGFVPFFNNKIAGFSVEEHTPRYLWFASDREGPWEWKGPVARTGSCIYGKLFCGKAGFVSRDWLPDFLNARRDGYDFDARYEDGLVAYKDKQLYDAIAEHGPMLTRELKQRCNYRKGGNTGFETVVTRLQMQTYLIIADFEYMKDQYGRAYGWGVARYSTPELQFGEEFVSSCYARPAEESWARMLAHLQALLPHATEEQIKRLLNWPKHK
jgi:hypothetical protein